MLVTCNLFIAQRGATAAVAGDRPPPGRGAARRPAKGKGSRRAWSCRNLSGKRELQQPSQRAGYASALVRKEASKAAN